MMGEDQFPELESQRLQLEQNIAELKKSIYHWRTWDAEYDGFKNGVSFLEEEGATFENVLQFGRQFGGTVITSEDIQALTGEKQGLQRTPRQVVDTVYRRIDYVRENIGILERRLATAEGHLDSVFQKINSADQEEEEELPLTEIIEELDEMGNAVKSRTKTPEEDAPKILRALKEAGMDKVLKNHRSRKAARSKPNGDKHEEIPRQVEEVENDESAHQSEPAPPKDEPKKPTAFPETGPVPETPPAPAKPSKSDDSPVPITQPASQPTVSSLPETPIDESPEDAALRREILQYGLEEAGDIVAELEIGDSGSDDSLDDEYATDDDEDEEEDEYGRTTRRVISDDYRRQMMELEKKLNAAGLHNLGPDPRGLPVEVKQELNQQDVQSAKQAPELAPEANMGQKQKKKVAFANSLDIAPNPEPAQKPAVEEAQGSSVPPVKDAIVEKTAERQMGSAQQSAPPKRPSRFKSARAASVRPMVLGPDIPEAKPVINPPPPPTLIPAKSDSPKPFSQPIVEPSHHSAPKPLVADLVERDVSTHAPAPDLDPDEYDEPLHRREIATEFYRMRNRRIQQQGGFVDRESEMIVPLGDDSAPERKPSRFKTARVRG